MFLAPTLPRPPKRSLYRHRRWLHRQAGSTRSPESTERNSVSARLRSIELRLTATELGLRIVAVLGTPGIRGGSWPKLSFFGETPGFLVFVDGLWAMFCSAAALKGMNAQSKDNSKTPAPAIGRVNNLKCIVNNQSPFRANVNT